MSLPDRFMAKVEFDPFGGCWLWSGALRKGYGCFYLDGKGVAAHRYAYLTLVGPFEEGLQPDHLCRVPCCVNPAHLEPVTTGENTRRGNSPGTRTSGAMHCAHGHLMTAKTRSGAKALPGALGDGAEHASAWSSKSTTPPTVRKSWLAMPSYTVRSERLWSNNVTDLPLLLQRVREASGQ